MIGDDAEGDVFLARQRRAVFLAAQFLQPTKDRREHVALVVRNGAGEVRKAGRALHDAGHALKAHAGIHVPGR